MRLVLSPAERRVAVLGTLLAGLVHLVVPELVLDVLRATYDASFDVSFLPRDRTAGRVRLVGVALCLVALLLVVVPDEPADRAIVD